MNIGLDGAAPVLIGVVHLKPLLGSPNYAGNSSAVVDTAIEDAQKLQAGGADAIIVENFGDQPFFRERCPDISFAAFVSAAQQISAAVSLPVGLNLLRNAGEQAVAAAAAVNASFVRVNVLVGARVTDQGVIEGRAAEIARIKQNYHKNLKIFADIAVKHSAPLGERPLVEEAQEALGRGGASAVIISGSGTGAQASVEEITMLHERGVGPILIGSGITAENVKSFAPFVSGVIVGTSVKVDQVVTNPVDQRAVEQLKLALR